MSKDLKRKRVAGTKGASKKSKINHVRSQQAPKKTFISSNALKWKEATLPDRLDDAEGFYGLEEIDDVEVVKDQQTGQIFFQTSNTDAVNGQEEVTENPEEWSGFDDESVPSSQLPSETDENHLEQRSNAHESQPVKSSPSESAFAHQRSTPKAAENVDEVEDVSFAALMDAANGSEDADVTAWNELDLSPKILSAISALGFGNPTPIQMAAIPPACAGHDVIGKAVTGSGKTLAFGIPVVERWLKHQKTATQSTDKNLVAFILAPTRELAHQLTKHLTALCKGLDSAPRIATVTGGLSVIKQQRQLETADIVVGTPGRLWEVINDSHGLIDRLRRIQFLVIDEADRLLSDGHFKEVEEILNVLDRKVTNDEDNNKARKVPQQRQTLIFSATFQKSLQQKLTSKQKWKQEDSSLLSNTQSLDYLLHKLKFQTGIKPTFVDANPKSQMAERLIESILECGAMQKDLYLYALLLLQQRQHTKVLRTKSNDSKNDRLTRTLVFTNSVSTVKRLVPLLSNLAIPSTSILPLQSSMPQKSRLRSLERFSAPTDQNITTTILIATDVAARGLDIKGIDTIIHYHVPRAADAYVHRSGRTARSTNSGRSILICSPEEVGGVTRLISKVHTDKVSQKSKGQQQSKPSRAAIQPMYLPANLAQQLQQRLSLAQKITNVNLDTSKTNHDSNFLRTAAEELGVDYDSDEFDAVSSKNKRGRGGGRDQKRKDNVASRSNGTVESWKAELKADIKARSIDFGDGEAIPRGARFLAGGAVDVERLLRERV